GRSAQRDKVAFGLNRVTTVARPERKPRMAKELDIAQIIQRHRDVLLGNWLKNLLAAGASRSGQLSEAELRRQCQRFLEELSGALRASDGSSDLSASAWAGVRQQLEELSASRAQLGFSPSETATFVFSLKEPLFEVLQREAGSNQAAILDPLW